MAKKKKYIWTIGGELPTIDEHSKVKLDILASYIQVYIETYAQYPLIGELKLSIVDGFTGGGVYKCGTTGSPIRILETVKKAKEVVAYKRESQNLRKINFSIDYFFVETDTNACKFLQNTINEFGFADEKITQINAEFQESLENILSEIKTKSRSQRCLFILDQYGYMDATIATVRHIFNQVNNAEVILTFSTDSLITYLCEDQEETLLNLGLDKQFIEELLDAKEDNHNNRAKMQPLLFKGIVESAGAEFYTPFFIKSDESNMSYWLFHFSSKAKARDEMVKLHWKHKNTFIHYGGAGLNMLGYDSIRNGPALYCFDEFAKEQSIKSLSNDVPEIIFGIDNITFGQLKNKILNTTPATVDMIKTSLNDFVVDRDIIVKSPDGIRKTKGSTIRDEDIITAKKRQYRFSFE